MTAQGANIAQWRSGLATAILKDDDEGNINAQLSADYTIYGPGGKPYLVIEVAYSQTLAQLRKKVDSWLSFPSVAGVITIKIEEKPPYKQPALTNFPSKLIWSDWSRTIEKCSKFGPIQIGDRVWAGVHGVTVAVFLQGKAEIQQVIGRLIF